MQKITPFLWFNNNLEEAMEFYASIFKNSEISTVSRYGEGAPFPPGTAMGATFLLDGVSFMGLNGGPMYTFSPAISLFVSCEDQEEIDHYWERLSEGGEKSRCGWLTDKFGVSWQVVPYNLHDLLSSGDADKAKRTLQAMLQMDKLDMEALENV
jgi:predicted 3-demethylubiquinone-9 3-methyltransferase (glyoxalase superfamily)